MNKHVKTWTLMMAMLAFCTGPAQAAEDAARRRFGLRCCLLLRKRKLPALDFSRLHPALRFQKRTAYFARRQRTDQRRKLLRHGVAFGLVPQARVLHPEDGIRIIDAIAGSHALLAFGVDLPGRRRG